MRVKPTQGMIVRRPKAPFTPIPESGINVPKNSYWNRRVRDGDVEVVAEASKVRPKPEPKQATSKPEKSTDK